MEFNVYSMKIANKLLERGIPMLRIYPNKKDVRYMVYVFADTKEFRTAFEECK